MASPKNIFAPDVGGINDPVSADGGGLVRAAATETQGKLTKATTTGKVIEAVGGGALEAYKGKLLSDAEKAIKDSLSKLEGFSEGAIEATKNLDHLKSNEFAANAALQLEQLAQQTREFDNDPTVRDFLATIERYKAAESQKVLSKQDVLNRIAATVKQYTALMPGWASDFRKAAAELTGISNIDVYGVHAALTQQSAKEKATEAMMKARINFIGEVSTRFGVSPEKVTPEMEQQHYQDKQLSVFKENAENKMKVIDATDKERERYFGEYVQAVTMQGVAKVSNAFSEFRKANAGVDLASKEVQTQIGGQVLAYLNDVEQAITVDIQKKTQRGPDNPYPMTYDQAKKYVDDTKAFIKTYKDNLQSEGGWNAFTLSVQAAEGDYNRMINNLMVANPYVAVLGKTGVLPEVAKLYLVLGGDKAKLEASVGKEATTAIDKFFRNPFSANFLGSTQIFPTAEAAAEVGGPDSVKIGWLDTVKTLDEYSKKDSLSAGERTNFVNKMVTYSNWFSPTDTKAMEDFKKKVASGEFVKLAGMLTDREKQLAFTPYFRKSETATKILLPRIEQLSRDAAADVTFDPNTGTFAAKFREGPTFLEGMGGSPRQELLRQIANINSIGSLMNDLKDEVFPSEQVPDIPTDMAALYGKILDNRLVELEAKKESIQTSQETFSGEDLGGDVLSSAVIGTDTFSAELKNVNTQISATKRALDSIGITQVRAARDKGSPEGKALPTQEFNALAPWKNAPSKPSKERDMKGFIAPKTASDAATDTNAQAVEYNTQLNNALDIPNPEGKAKVTARPPLEAVRNLDALIAIQVQKTRGEGSIEQKRLAAKHMKEAQLIRLEKLGQMSEAEKDIYYGAGRTR